MKQQTKGMTRVTSNSRLGRSLISVGKTFYPSEIPEDIQHWNSQVEMKKLMKKESKKRAKQGEQK